MAKTPRKAKTPPPQYPMTVETFTPPRYQLQQLERCGRGPSSFNGQIKIHRYRVTAERIDEPVEVLAARLQKLWEECDNLHHWTPLQSAAHELGITLDPATRGIRRAAR